MFMLQQVVREKQEGDSGYEISVSGREGVSSLIASGPAKTKTLYEVVQDYPFLFGCENGENYPLMVVFHNPVSDHPLIEADSVLSQREAAIVIVLEPPESKQLLIGKSTKAPLPISVDSGDLLFLPEDHTCIAQKGACLCHVLLGGTFGDQQMRMNLLQEKVFDSDFCRIEVAEPSGSYINDNKKAQVLTVVEGMLVAEGEIVSTGKSIIILPGEQLHFKHKAKALIITPK